METSWSMAMIELALISLMEFTLMMIIWPKLAVERVGWSNRALLRDNPHLRVCYLARKWISPVLFVFFSGLSIYIFGGHIHDSMEVVMLNIVVLMSSWIIGLAVSESIVRLYRYH